MRHLDAVRICRSSIVLDSSKLSRGTFVSQGAVPPLPAFGSLLSPIAHLLLFHLLDARLTPTALLLMLNLPGLPLAISPFLQSSFSCCVCALFLNSLAILGYCAKALLLYSMVYKDLPH